MVFSKPLGTSDINGSSHGLTAGEAAGQTFELSASIGVQSFSQWQQNHSLIQLSLQDGANAWLDSQMVFTGTSDEATTLGLTLGDIDVFLGLDDTLLNGDSNTWTYQATVAGTPPNLSEELRYAVNAFHTDGNTRAVLDDMTISVIPEPGTYALLAGTLALTTVMIRHRAQF